MEQITNPAGLRVLGSLIQLVENKAEIKKVLAELNQARDEANKKIAVVGTIREIDSLKSEAETLLAEADNTLAQAKREAETLLKKAGVKATSQKEKQRRAAEILSAQEARDQTLAARESSVTAREQELQAHMDQAKSLHAEATGLKATADELMAKANEQLAVFRQAAASIN